MLKVIVEADTTALDAALAAAIQSTLDHQQQHLTALETRARALQEPAHVMLLATAAVVAAPRRLSRRQLFGLGWRRR